VGSTRTADHPRDQKYAHASIILFYYLLPTRASGLAAPGPRERPTPPPSAKSAPRAPSHSALATRSSMDARAGERVIRHHILASLSYTPLSCTSLSCRMPPRRCRYLCRGRDRWGRSGWWLRWGLCDRRGERRSVRLQTVTAMWAAVYWTRGCAWDLGGSCKKRESLGSVAPLVM
jgi:hypothetical protein